MSDVKLMKPLFYCGNFNAGGKRMKAVLVKEVSDGANAYRLWRSSGVPDRDYPRAEDYLRTYREQTEELHLLASKLMRMIDPNAGETRIGGGAQSVQAAQPTVTLPTDAVSEIQKYKALLDAGVLTEEEFSAKKRQLLGI